MNLSVYGLNIDDIWARIKALQPDRAGRAERLIEIALADCYTPLHVLSERMAAAGDPEIAIEDLRWVMDFVKLWRRLTVIRALIDLPALFSTAYVPPEFERRCPDKFTLLTRPQTVPLYGRYRFVVNVNPLIDCFHERVTESLRNNSVCVTDPNAVIARHFRDDVDMLFIDYRRGDLTERAWRLIDDPEAAFAMTVSSFAQRSRPEFEGNAHARLIAAARAWAS
jgi:hypothetical protein